MAAATPNLTGTLYALVPADGTTIGNGSLRKALSDHLGREVPEADYFEAQQALVDVGRLVKGKGRGGSVARTAAGNEALSLPPRRCRRRPRPRSRSRRR